MVSLPLTVDPGTSAGMQRSLAATKKPRGVLNGSVLSCDCFSVIYIYVYIYVYIYIHTLTKKTLRLRDPGYSD